MTKQRMLGLVATSSPDFIARTFAAWNAGAAVVVARSADDGERLRVAGATELVRPAPGHGWVDVRFEPRELESVAQVLFTSGTEGEPKGVVLTHGNLADVVERLNAVMEVTGEIREYVGVPVHHSFGFGRCRAVSQAGGRAYLPERGFNPVELNALLEAATVNAVSAVPSLWRVLLASGALSARAGRRARWIEIGSQTLSAAEKRALVELFPNAIIVQHYGLTEASRTTFLRVDGASEDELQSVGRATGRVEVAVSEQGRIRIRGPHVTSRLLVGGAPLDPRDAGGWLTTSDRGELHGGLLRFLGRADDVINCGGVKLSPDALEASVRERLGVGSELGVCRVPHALRGEGILLAVPASCPQRDAELTDALVQAAAALNVNARDAVHVWRVPQLPRTDTGKLVRSELARRFAEARAAAPPAASLPSAPAGGLRAELAAMLDLPSLGDRDSFVQSGGDSLRFIQASVCVERRLGHLPRGWEALGMAELEALATPEAQLESGARGSQVEPAIVVRAVAITSVVLNHTGAFDTLFPIDGAAFLLLLPAGQSFARFQLQRVLETGRSRWALAALPRVLLPAALVLLVQQARHHEPVLSQLLFYHNFVSPPGGFNYWFIEVYAQLHVVLAAALCVPGLRRSLARRPYQASVAALLGAALAAAALPLLWNTDHLGNLLPHLAAWYLVLGSCVQLGTQRWQRWLNSGLLVALAAVFLPGTSRGVWLVGGGLFLIWAKPLRLPAAAARALATLAAASLYIYISHWLVLEPTARLLPALGVPGQVLVAWLTGVGFWFAFERAWQLGRRAVGRRRSAGAGAPRSLVPESRSTPPPTPSVGLP